MVDVGHRAGASGKVDVEVGHQALEHREVAFLAAAGELVVAEPSREPVRAVAAAELVVAAAAHENVEIVAAVELVAGAASAEEVVARVSEISERDGPLKVAEKIIAVAAEDLADRRGVIVLEIIVAAAEQDVAADRPAVVDQLVPKVGSLDGGRPAGRDAAAGIDPEIIAGTGDDDGRPRGAGKVGDRDDLIRVAAD